MSSPLAVFRKYQKTLLAIFGVALMLVFTVGSFVDGFFARRGQPTQRDAVVVTYDGGKITESDLEIWRFQRNVVQRFIQSVAIEATQRNAKIDPRQLAFLGSDSEEELVLTKLLSDEAVNLGIEINDEDVIQFIDQLTQGQIDRSEYEELLKNLTQGRMSPRQFIHAMRNQLLALRYWDLVRQGLSNVTPSAYWDSFQRLNRRIAITAVPYPVSQFLDKTAAPTDEEVRAMYEEGKHQYSHPSSPEPGFKVRKQVALEYIKAELEPLVEEEKPKVTDAEIQEYYNTHKDQFKNLELPSESDTKENATGGDAPGTEAAKDAGSTPSDTTHPESAPESTPPSTSPEAEVPVNPPSQPATDEASQPAQEATSQTPSLETEGVSNNPGEEASQESESPSDPTDGDPAPESTDNATEETSQTEADSGKGAESTPAPDAGGQAAPETDDKVAEKTDVAEENGADDSAGNDSAAQPGTDQQDTESPRDPQAASAEPRAEQTNETELEDLPEDLIEKKPEYKPLEEVSDEIRTLLARQKANTRLEDYLNQIQGQMRQYFGKYVNWEAMPNREEVKPPRSPDLAKLAAPYGFTTGRTPLVNDLELVHRDPATNEYRYEIGSAYEIDTSNGINRITIAGIVFGEDLKKYEVRRIQGGVLDTFFIFWKTDEKEARVPELDECRDQVVRAIQMKQALHLATDKAKADIQQLRQSGRSLAEYFRDRNKQIIETGSFTWLTLGYLTQGSVMLSDIPGIPHAGNKFMQSVVRLQKGEIGVAVNNAEDTVYVCQVTSEESNPEGLREAFGKSGITPDLLQVHRVVSDQRLGEWYQDYLKRHNVKWQRTPEEGARSANG
jgi:hypothetical protein